MWTRGTCGTSGTGGTLGTHGTGGTRGTGRTGGTHGTRGTSGTGGIRWTRGTQAHWCVGSLVRSSAPLLLVGVGWDCMDVMEVASKL